MKAKKKWIFSGKEDFKNLIKIRLYGFARSNKYDITYYS
jgi:hypothetical protein